MKRLVRSSAILWIVLGMAAVCVFAEPIASLRPSNYVNDFAGVLDAQTQASLNDLCQQVDQKANAQIAVVTVKSLDGQDIDSYTQALLSEVGDRREEDGPWCIDSAGEQRSQTLHSYVGYGVEPILPDGKVGGFGREAVPLLQSRGLRGCCHVDDVARSVGDRPGCGCHAGKSAGDARASAHASAAR